MLLCLLSSLAKAQQAQPPVQNAAEVAQQLHRACNEVGFFYVSSIVPACGLSAWHNIQARYGFMMQVANHGVPTQACQNVLKEAHAWFALPVTR